MFSGNTKGTMEVNQLRLREIRNDIQTRRLAEQMMNKKSWRDFLLEYINKLRGLLKGRTDTISTEKQPTEKIRAS